MDNKAKFLKSVQLFSLLSSSDLEALGHMCREKRFSRGQFLFQEGDEAQWVFILKEGEAKILKQSASGKDIIIRLISPGGFMGEISMFDGVSYPASAQALGDIVVYGISKDSMLSFIQKNPEVIFNFIGVCVKRLRETYAVIRELGTKDLEGRIAVTLLNLAETIGEKMDGQVRLNAPLTRQDLAEMVGCTKESVSRVMANLKREGILRSYSKRILIISLDRLRVISKEMED